MKVSVLIPYYNDEKFLGRAIESVLNQSFTDFELILVNHATTDSCRTIAHSYKDERIVHYDMEKNYGAGTGLVLERILKFAKGEYIKLFCADDILYKDGLKNLVEYMDNHPEKAFAIANVDYIDDNDKVVKSFVYKKLNFCDGQHDEVDALKAFFIGHGFLPYIANIIRTDVLKSVEIDVSFIAQFDMVLWLSMLVKGYKMGLIDNYVAGWRVHENQMSAVKFRKKIFKCRDIEHIKYIEQFYKIDDLGLLKQVFPKNPYLRTVKDITKDDFRFIVSYEMLNSESDGICYRGYFELYDMIQNPDTREYLENKFHFGIKELREIYSVHGLKLPYKQNKIARIIRLLKVWFIIK